jgi:phage repressor protein C with HTH and peptisase S24 domain
LRSRKPESAAFATQGGELSLSGPALVELLLAVLGEGKPFRFRATGPSMSPCIQDGDVILVAPLPLGASARLGQVVAFVHSGTRQLAVHRVVAKRGGSFLLKGDNSSLADGLFPAASILGYVVTVERDGQEVRIGLGPERLLIAFLTRWRPLWYWLRPVWRLIRPIARRAAM